MEMTAEKQTSSFRFEVTNAMITATMASVIEGAATHHGQYHHNLIHGRIVIFDNVTHVERLVCHRVVNRS